MNHAPIAIVVLALCSITDSPPEAPEVAQQVEIEWLPAKVSRWAPQIEAAAAAHHVDADLVAIVVLAESGGDPGATSSAGAKGLMQVMPQTAEAIARQRHLDAPSTEELEDPELNLDFGAYLLSQLIADLADDDLDAEEIGLVAAAYNGGLERVLRWQAGKAKLSKETEHYRAKVMRLWRKRAAIAR